MGVEAGRGATGGGGAGGLGRRAMPARTSAALAIAGEAAARRRVGSGDRPLARSDPAHVHQHLGAGGLDSSTSSSTAFAGPVAATSRTTGREPQSPPVRELPGREVRRSARWPGRSPRRR